MAQEVELRTILSASGRKALPAKLRKIGFVRRDASYLRDVYYCARSVKSFSEVEMNEVGSYSLRLRRRSKKDTTGAELNLKVITQFGDHHSWQEHEIMTDSFSGAESILEAIGFKPFFSLEKKRITYKRGNITLCVEDIKDFKPCLELEILTTKARAGKAKDLLLNILADLQIEKSAIVSKSITNMLMRKQARF